VSFFITRDPGNFAAVAGPFPDDGEVPLLAAWMEAFGPS
jgi:hypothetical protein